MFNLIDLSSFKKTPKNIEFKDLIVSENDDFILINKPPF
ncbi:MAG: hypothetical protein ACI8UX_002143, partial [Psychromonas sp.]